MVTFFGDISSNFNPRYCIILAPFLNNVIKLIDRIQITRCNGKEADFTMLSTDNVSSKIHVSVKHSNLGTFVLLNQGQGYFSDHKSKSRISSYVKPTRIYNSLKVALGNGESSLVNWPTEVTSYHLAHNKVQEAITTCSDTVPMEKHTALLTQFGQLKTAGDQLIIANLDLIRANTNLINAKTELVKANSELLVSNTELVGTNTDLLEVNAKLAEVILELKSSKSISSRLFGWLKFW